MTKPRKCIHFNGTFRKSCRLGFVYETMARSMTTLEKNRAESSISLETPISILADRIPCLAKNNVNTCQHYAETAVEPNPNDAISFGLVKHRDPQAIEAIKNTLKIMSFANLERKLINDHSKDMPPSVIADFIGAARYILAEGLLDEKPDNQPDEEP